MNKTVKRLLIFSVIGIVIFLVLYPKLGLFSSDVAAGPGGPGGGGPGGGQMLTVSGIIAKPDVLENRLTVTGEIIANESLEIRSEISGKIEKIFFEEGQNVKRNTMLLKINVDELTAQLEKVKYTSKLREGSEFRQRQLLEREAISQEEYDQALTELQTNQADIKLLETQIAKSEIRAPFDGVIGLRHVSVGSYVTSATVISNFYNINPVKVQFDLPGKYSNRVQVGNEITFKVDASNESFKGKVYAREPKLNSETRTITLRAISNNDRALLLPGQFTRIEFILDRKNNAIMAPTQAAIPELNGTKMYLLKGGKVAPVMVETGIRTETHLEILSGISPNDTVITSGVLQIRPGMPVNVDIF